MDSNSFTPYWSATLGLLTKIRLSGSWFPSARAFCSPPYQHDPPRWISLGFWFAQQGRCTCSSR